MNDDRDIETLLRRYRPLEPPPDLRVRVLSAPADTRRAWPWAVAAAALLAASVGLHVARELVVRQLGSTERPLQLDERGAALVELERTLGGGVDARKFAERIMRERDLANAAEASEMPLGADGSPR